MKRLAVLMFLFLSASCITASAANSGDTLLNSGSSQEELSRVSPELKATEEPLWDFGKVREGDVVSHDFAIKNNSSSVMGIREISTSCGCTLSRIKKMIAKPGESTIIEVKFNSKGYKGKVKQFVYVTMQGEGIDKPVLRYIIEADVVAAKN